MQRSYGDAGSLKKFDKKCGAYSGAPLNRGHVTAKMQDGGMPLAETYARQGTGAPASKCSFWLLVKTISGLLKLLINLWNHIVSIPLYRTLAVLNINFKYISPERNKAILNTCIYIYFGDHQITSLMPGIFEFRHRYSTLILDTDILFRHRYPTRIVFVNPCVCHFVTATSFYVTNSPTSRHKISIVNAIYTSDRETGSTLVCRLASFGSNNCKVITLDKCITYIYSLYVHKFNIYIKMSNFIIQINHVKPCKFTLDLGCL